MMKLTKAITVKAFNRILLYVVLLWPTVNMAQTGNILMFVSYEDTYYSEYIVMLKALQASGYMVDVRSADTGFASTYMIPANTDISATAATLPGGSYNQFLQQYNLLFASTWNPSWNPTPSFVPVNGRIQDVNGISGYDALVVAGGTGITAYRVDGSYTSQGSGARTISSSVVQSASLKLNALALEALSQGKPVLGQCHGAALPAFWRIPGISGVGIDSIGYSLLRGNQACGFPEPQTATNLNLLGINYRSEDRITISSPHTSFPNYHNGRSKIITTRDWYPQTVASAARTLIDVLQTFPEGNKLLQPVNVLILHGGIIDSTNCNAANRQNDVPCNHGVGNDLPADYRHVQNLLLADSPNDSFVFNVSELNIKSLTLPYAPNSTASILNYLNGFDVVVFFKHWSDAVTIQLQNALVQFADGGKGVLALHHALYNDSISNTLNKNIIRDQLFGAQSSSNTWSGVSLANYNLFATNYGHFISAYGINYSSPLQSPGVWSTNSLPVTANSTYSFLPRVPIYDETYNNMTFIPGQQFGRGINQINPLFSNDQSPASQCHVAGFTKLFNPSQDGTVGKLVFLQPGERRESVNINHAYGQVIRNAVLWLGNDTIHYILPVDLISFQLKCERENGRVFWQTASEKNNSHFVLEHSLNGDTWFEHETVKASQNTSGIQTYGVNHLPDGNYRLKQVDNDGAVSYSDEVTCNCSANHDVRILPNPSAGSVSIVWDNPLITQLSLKVINVQGEVVHRKDCVSTENGQCQLIIPSINSGVYFLEINAAGKVIHKKLIINN